MLLLILFSGTCFSQEICDNGIDDDGDGNVDLNDAECLCATTNISSIIPNASFEDFSICPSNFGELQLCTGWDQVTDASTDYLNTCGYVATAVPDIGLVPFPDGQGIVGGYIHTIYREYIGRCLTNPLTPGTIYQLTFDIAALPINAGNQSACTHPGITYDPINITLYGSSNCQNLPVATWLNPNDTDSSWEILGYAYYNPAAKWGKLTITFTPDTTIQAVMIGSPETLSDSYAIDTSIDNFCSPYFLYDNLILNEAAVFGVNIEAAGNYCTGNLTLTAVAAVPLSSTATYQWYLEGVAITAATSASYIVPPNSTGLYTVKVSNGGNCYISIPYTVTNIMQGPDFSITPPTCYINGTISISTAADLYSFDNGVTWVTNPVKNNLPPGNYFIKVRYNSGCLSGASAVVLETPAYLPSPLFNVTDATCGPTGTITITSPGTQFSFDGGATWTVDNTLTQVNGGDYNIMIKDSAGCASFPATAHVGQQFLPNPTNNIINPTCGNNGSITITTGAAEYSFDGGITWQNTPTLSGIGPGTYPISIKDSAGCISDPMNVFLMQYLPGPAYTIIPPGCTNNGSITITTTPALSYSFDAGVTWTSNPTLSGLGAGVYSIAFKYPGNCISTIVNVTLYQTVLQFYPQYQMIAEGCEPGSITITTAGDQYSFDSGATWQSSPQLTGLSSGNYGLAVKDLAGCSSFIKSVNLPYIPGSLADPDYQTTPDNCSGNGSITITTIASSYSFDGGINWSASNISPPLAAGNYSIQIRNTTGCVSGIVPVIINTSAVPAPAPLEFVYCQYEAASALNVPGNQLLWYNSSFGGLGSSTSPTPSTASVGTSTYYVSQTISNCESTRSAITVRVLPRPAPPVLGSISEYCEDSETVALSAMGANLLWYSNITGGLGSSLAPIPSSEVSGTFTWFVSQTIDGCESERAAVTVIIKPTPLAPDTTLNIYYHLNDTALPLAASGIALNWYDSQFVLLNQPPLPNTQFSGIITYYVSQSIEGCEGPLAKIIVEILPLYQTIEYPHFFSPNNDGYNDFWNLFPLRNNANANTFIFDRYGKLLKQISVHGKGWDGTYNGYNLPASDYWFLVEYTEFGIQKEFRAHFSLIR